MIAVWPSAPPSTVAKPAMRRGSRSAVSAGLNSSAISTEPLGEAVKARRCDLTRLRSSRAPTSRMSSMRAAKYASSISSKPLAISEISAWIAASALTSEREMRSSTPRMSREPMSMWRWASRR